MRLLLTLSILCILLRADGQQDAPSFFADGKKAQTAKNYTAALEQFKKATAKKPDYGEAWYELGWTYNELAKYDDAVMSLRNAKTYLKDEARVFYESGFANDFAGKTADAVSDYKRCLELSPDYAASYRQLGNISYDVEANYGQALDYYNSYVNRSVDTAISANTWYKKGYCEIEATLYEDALVSIGRAIAIDDQYTVAYNELGYALYKLGRSDDAIAAYRKSYDIDSKSSVPCAGLGDIYRVLLKNIDEAFAWYQKGLALTPNSQNCNYGLGWCNNEKSNHEAALPFLQKAISLNDQFTAAHTELGYAYYALKQYDNALVELDKSLQQVESSAAFFYKGLCYVAQQQKAKAQEVYDRMNKLKLRNAPDLLEKIEEMK